MHPDRRYGRGEITLEQRKLARQETESDLACNVLTHTPIPADDRVKALWALPGITD